MAYVNRNQITIENAEIMYSKTSPNFSGAAHQYNAEGNRNFCMFIDDENLAQDMINAGWNIKELPPRPDHPEDHVRYFLSVTVKYRKIDGTPVQQLPEVYIVANGKPKPLSEKSIGSLDKRQIKYVDVRLNPRIKDDGTIKAYAAELYVTVESNPLADKYAMDEYPEDDFAPGDDPFAG